MRLPQLRSRSLPVVHIQRIIEFFVNKAERKVMSDRRRDLRVERNVAMEPVNPGIVVGKPAIS